jgi:putative sterol carrier protein
MSQLSARDMMSRMESAFQPEKAQGVTKTIQFTLTGDDGGTWTARITNGACKVTEEAAEDANVTLTTETRHFVDLMAGKLNPAMAFMGGKLKLKGDMMLAQKLMQYFNLKSLNA